MTSPIAVIRDEMNAAVKLEDVIEDSAIDSLEYIELVRRLEAMFGIEINEKELERVETFGELCNVVDRLRKRADLPS